MLSQLSNIIPSFRHFSKQPAERTVEVPPVETHNIETAHEKSARSLKHLLKLNHVKFSVLYRELSFYNHIPHFLSTAYLLGGDAEHLNQLYESESKELEPWVDSPGEIGDDDWKAFLGKREYQRAWLDFFEDEVVRCGYDWKQVAQEYLFADTTPLISSVVSGCYAYEIGSREVAMEALSMAASCYGDIHQYSDDPSYRHFTSTYKTASVFEGIDRLQNDKAFDDLFEGTSVANFDTLFKSCETPLLNHWAAWDITNATEQFEDIQQLATALLVNSARPHKSSFVYLLTTTHALRVIFPLTPAQFHIPLLKQWWLLALAVYVSELRPQFNASSINEIKTYDLKGRTWDWVSQNALQGKMSVAANYVQPLRAMREAERTQLKGSLVNLTAVWGGGARGGTETRGKSNTANSGALHVCRVCMCLAALDLVRATSLDNVPRQLLAQPKNKTPKLGGNHLRHSRLKDPIHTMTTQNLAKPRLYAELFPNISQITVYVTLLDYHPAPSSTGTSQAFFEVLPSRETLSFSYRGQKQVLRLPGRLSSETPLKFSLPPKFANDKRTTTTHENEFHFRLQVDVTDPLTTPSDISSPQPPWSAKHMNPDTRIGCRNCGNYLLEPQKPAQIIWKDLPSANWAELMDLWHCHKPDSHEDDKQRHGDGDASANIGSVAAKGYGAGNHTVCQADTVLVDAMNFYLTETNCVGVEPTVR
ncbi:predicted protein [Uncinocarpus reesii 1704]|uniref:Uncharacterized protein n=1 Tax=Uncinocarpus reesii (strain UAMH 1704) TaxID=336963 RepID=C4JHY1_UNCRE|nr:uncharacterized protein UREG_01406 [Uncinocarpus reesii 1704]EEP76557.1 predicted protein [Uncinocarpus reesii 1704]